MNAGPKSSTRLFWIAGLVLLLGTALGVGFAFNNGVSGSGVPAGAADKSDLMPAKAICLGYVDGENGVIPLHPMQLGRILDVRDEGFAAKKNDWLLKLDDRLASKQLEQAEALLLQAKKLPQQHKFKMDQQQQAVDAAEHHKKWADLELEIAFSAEKIDDKNDRFKKTKKAAQEKVDMLGCQVKAEKSKLEELKLDDPLLKLQIAQAKYDQAKLALEECTVRAPEDGTLLRVLVHRGEALGANPKFPALQFVNAGKKIIRAEVLQEWAGKVRDKQVVEIEDDTTADPKAPKWKGTIKRLSPWFAHKRSIIFEPFNYNDVRTLECIIQLNDSDQNLRIGQRVRVSIRLEP